MVKTDFYGNVRINIPLFSKKVLFCFCRFVKCRQLINYWLLPRAVVAELVDAQR